MGRYYNLHLSWKWEISYTSERSAVHSSCSSQPAISSLNVQAPVSFSTHDYGISFASIHRFTSSIDFSLQPAAILTGALSCRKQPSKHALSKRAPARRYKIPCRQSSINRNNNSGSGLSQAVRLVPAVLPIVLLLSHSLTSSHPRGDLSPASRARI